MPFIITKDYITKKGQEGYATGRHTFGLIETPTGVSAPTLTKIKEVFGDKLLKAQLRDDDNIVYYDALVYEDESDGPYSEDDVEQLFDWGHGWAGTARLYLWQVITEESIRYGLVDNEKLKVGDSGWINTIS